MILSDERLKENIEVLKVMPNGIEIVSWTWNETAKKLGLTNSFNFGVIAQQVKDILPNAVRMDESSGYYRVNYSEIF